MEWLWAAMDADKENPGQTNTTGYLKRFAGDDAGHTRAVGNYAWHLNNSSNKTHQVRKKEPNELGLFDMSGNVAEWCWDLIPNTWPSGKIEDYTPESNSDNSRMITGYNYSTDLSLPMTMEQYYTYLLGNTPYGKGTNTGFRLVFSE
jgi:formylglycine-generating enzyme required for sulfatase activity